MLIKRCLAVVLLFAAANVSAQVLVTDAWVRESIPGTSSSALFATLTNEGKKDRKLVRVEVQGADKTELHTSQQVDGMMRMRRLESIALPAGQSQSLAPGGDHVMLFRLAEPLRAGAKLNATFYFDNDEKVQVSANVKAGGGGHHHHH